MKKIIDFLILNLICLFLNIRALDSLENKLSFQIEARKIAIEVINTITKKSNEQFIKESEPLFKDCFDMITADLVNGTFEHVVYNSGHGLMKIGNQNDCEEENYAYHLFSLNILPETLDSPNEDLNEFIGFKSYNLGMCLWKKCTNAIQALLAKEANPDLFNFFYEYKNITNVTQYNTKHDMVLSRRFYVTFLFFIFPFFGIRVLLSWINDFFIEGDENDEEEKMRKHQLSMQKLNESIHESMLDEYADLNKSIGKVKDDLQDKDKQKSRDDSASYISSDSLFKEYGAKNNESEIENLAQYINTNFPHNARNGSPGNNSKPITCKSFFSLFTDIFLGKISHRNLFNITNSIFNESGIEILSGLRAFHMFFATIFRVFKTFYEIPSTSYGNLDFYNSYYLGIIKYASFSLYAWIYLDGFLYCYKLMFYLKKHKKHHSDTIPFVFYIKFFISSIMPKMIVFIIVFYTFILNMNNLAILYGKTFLFQKYYEET